MQTATIPSQPVPEDQSHGPVPRTLPITGFVRQEVVLHFIPFSKSTLWRQVNAGSFPAPIHLSAGITAWRAEDVRRWIAERK